MTKKPTKTDSRLPVVISLLVPGGGQIAQGRVFMGVIFQITLTLLFIAITIGLIANGIHMVRYALRGGDITIGMLFRGIGYPALGMLIIYLWNLVDAHVVTKRIAEKGAPAPETE